MRARSRSSPWSCSCTGRSRARRRRRQRLARREAWAHERVTTIPARARLSARVSETTAAARSGGRVNSWMTLLPSALAGHGQWLALPNDAPGEGRTGGAGELHREILAELRRTARDEHGAEVARAGHEHRLATARLALDEHLVPRAERTEVAGA